MYEKFLFLLSQFYLTSVTDITVLQYENQCFMFDDVCFSRWDWCIWNYVTLLNEMIAFTQAI